MEKKDKTNQGYRVNVSTKFQPINEGTSIKGGKKPQQSKIVVRPKAPAPMKPKKS